jgi:uncharacterized membrane protein YjjP (DUF1212 family)
MNITKNVDHGFAAIAVCILLLLTPWPAAMLIASAIGLVGWLLVYRGRKRSQGLLVALVAFVVAAALAVFIWSNRGH